MSDDGWTPGSPGLVGKPKNRFEQVLDKIMEQGETAMLFELGGSSDIVEALKIASENTKRGITHRKDLERGVWFSGG